METKTAVKWGIALLIGVGVIVLGFRFAAWLLTGFFILNCLVLRTDKAVGQGSSILEKVSKPAPKPAPATTPAAPATTPAAPATTPSTTPAKPQSNTQPASQPPASSPPAPAQPRKP